MSVHGLSCTRTHRARSPLPVRRHMGAQLFCTSRMVHAHKQGPTIQAFSPCTTFSQVPHRHRPSLYVCDGCSALLAMCAQTPCTPPYTLPSPLAGRYPHLDPLHTPSIHFSLPTQTYMHTRTLCTPPRPPPPHPAKHTTPAPSPPSRRPVQGDPGSGLRGPVPGRSPGAGASPALPG